MMIREVARLTGITVRTLQYYDRIGLLKPAEVTKARYRVYDTESLRRLQQILFFRELDFPLKDIRDIMEAPSYSQTDVLSRQKSLLLKKRERLTRLITLCDTAIKEETDVKFDAFDASELETEKTKYADEARQRWGNTPAYAEYEQKAAGDKDAFASNEKEMFAFFDRVAAHRGESPDSPAVQQLVAEWQAFITAHFYTCNKEMLSGLGAMYTADERFRRNIDKSGEGTAQLLSDAIAVYCQSES